MKKRIENLIPIALEVLEKEFKDTVPSEYNGYISAFGAGIIQSGLKPTIAIYESKNSKTKSDKDTLTRLILEIIKIYEEKEDIKTDSLLRYVINSNKSENYLKELIKDSAIAIKLAMRTFEFKKDK